MGQKATEVYREMLANCSVIAAALYAIDMLMRQVDWRVEPADESQQAMETAEFVDSCRADMSTSWPDTLSEIFSMVPYGWAYHEIVYKRREGQKQGSPGSSSKYDDGLVGWRKLPIRSQDSRLRWELDDSGGVKGMWQSAPPTYEQVFIPIEKALLFRPGSHKNNPEGRSALRGAYRAWYFAKRIETIEAIGVERDLCGLPVLSAPAEVCDPNASADLKAIQTSLKQMIRNIRRDEQEGVLLPQAYDENGNPLYKLELLASGGKRQFNTGEIITRYDTRMVQTMLADFIMLGHEKVGSFALSSDKTNLFSVALGSWLDAVAEVFNRHGIPRLMRLNGIDETLTPKLVHGDIETPDIAEFTAAIKTLTDAGMPLWPDRKLEADIRSKLGIPELTEEEMDQRDDAMEEQKVAEFEAQRELMEAKANKPTEETDNGIQER